MPRKKIEPQPESPPEPSVLDYLKAVVRGEPRPDIPVPQEEAPPPVAPVRGRRKAAATEAAPVAVPPARRGRAAPAATTEPVPELLEPEREPAGPFPWLAVLALLAGLAAQSFLNQQQSQTLSGGLLFLLAVAGAAWAYLRGDWQLAEPAASDPETPPDPLKVRPLPLMLTALAAGSAFWAFGGNLFTAENLALWALAFVFTLWTFWLRDPNSPTRWWPAPDPEAPRDRRVLLAYGLLLLALVFVGSALAGLVDGLFALRQVGLAALLVVLAFRWHPPLWWQELNAVLARPSWNVRITRFGLLLALAFALAAFYRFFRLDAVPADMFSDQAEKLLDVMDVLNGQYSIFFIRNTGREPLQFYLTAAAASFFQTGISFLSLKIVTATLGFLSLIYVYLLGKEVGGRQVGLLALFLGGMSTWINIQARVALRFILYPAFVAPALFYLLRGIRRRARNDFILSGIFLGIGLHGYTPIRALPIAMVVAVVLYLLHRQSQGNRGQVLVHFGLLALVAGILFLPLARYALEEPGRFTLRSLSRLSSLERELPGSPLVIFFGNLWDGLKMFNVSAGSIWPVSLTYRPLLDSVSAVLLVLGAGLVLVRYLQKRHWQDIFLLLAVPLLMLPSILSLAFPEENPAPNRASGAAVIVFILCALALDGLLRAVLERLGTRRGQLAAGALGALLLGLAALQNYSLTFNQYAAHYAERAWNASEMGRVMQTYAEAGIPLEQSWVLPYPHWVDTRLVGFSIGQPGRDVAIPREQVAESSLLPGAKLFLLKYEDEEGLALLRELYPQASYSLYHSPTPFRDFYIFLVPAGQ